MTRKKDHTLRAKIIMEFTMDNIIDQMALDEHYNGSMRKCITNMFKDDHFIGFVNDQYKILSVEVLP